MPKSVLALTAGDVGDHKSAISSTSSLSELLDLVPAPYRPLMQDLINKVYKAAIKSNHARSYLSTLEKHLQDGDYPPEIGARIQPPALQITKEFSSAAQYKEAKGQMDTASTAHKKAMLKDAIEIKKAEVIFLQGLFAEHTYKEEAKLILDRVTNDLRRDAGMEDVTMADGTTANSSVPDWLRVDYTLMNKHYMLYPARAVALAFMQTSAEMSKKMRALSLKKNTVKDVDMEEGQHRTETVDQAVARKFNALLKEHKLANVGNGGKGRKKNPSSTPNRNEQKRISFKAKKKGGKRGNSPGGKGKGKK